MIGKIEIVFSDIIVNRDKPFKELNCDWTDEARRAISGEGGISPKRGSERRSRANVLWLM
jgi:hypothetical protein